MNSLEETEQVDTLSPLFVQFSQKNTYNALLNIKEQDRLYCPLLAEKNTIRLFQNLQGHPTMVSS